jgi:D-threo-aldose 1-dehydrogenase
MDHAQWDVFLLANRYTLLDQEVIDTLLPRCVREGVAIVDGAPLHNGLLATGTVPGARYDYAPASEQILDKVRGIEAACKRHGVPLLRAALNFPLGHEAIASIIPGPVTTAELASNLSHFHATIPPTLWDDLKAQGLLHNAAPAPVTPALK